MTRRIHVIPIGDEEIHAAQESCWCHPTVTEPLVVTHNAKDCREAAERATGEKCSEGWINIAENISYTEGETEAGIIYREVHAVVKRSLPEYDKLTTFGVIGALEAVKLDVLDMLARHNGNARPGDGE